MTGTKVKVRAMTGTEVKKNLGDDGYATANDGYRVGRRRLLDRATTGHARARTAEIGRRQVLGGQRRLRSRDDGSQVGQ